VYEGEWDDSKLIKYKYDLSSPKKGKSLSSKVDLSSTGTSHIGRGLNFRVKRSKVYNKSADSKF
jgi:hypothetical protein